MERDITASRIANAIMQEGNFEGGVYILLEGIKDVRLYSRFFDEKSTRIRQTYGKYKQREVYRILTERNFASKLGVRDSDFLKVRGNAKFDLNYSDDIFITDGHDSEVMILNSDALSKYLLAVSSEEKIENFEKKIGSDIRTYIFKLAEPMGYLRYANKKFKLGLSFKPEYPEGNKIKFKKFICEKNLIYLGHEQMVRAVCDYSKNRGQQVSSCEEIIRKLVEVSDLKIPLSDLVNGHDLSEILSLILVKGLKSESNLARGQDVVESALALSYELRYFKKSTLFVNIQKWANASGLEIFQN
ncbi:hypothetical protein PSQ39_17455 [Curvibacter sp. HBC28]|uniref:DUF4435 domain-containing protein n=1 Tax=Curvibacter microcysteis TaxID=3026419 RepID=A0ABT5MJ79_9BURK|nr:DUF4435 domain-containing protein [Curvibacter sp. HBC28]MDD0816430.1 hypothetical protein [Curvibacter sp. HBC28]